MFEHPFTNSAFNKIVGSLLILVAVMVQWGLLVLYVRIPLYPALADSILSVGLLSAAGYAGWFFITYINVWQARAAVAVLIQIVCLAVTYSVLAIFKIEDSDLFLFSMPLRLIFGLLCWIILIQWYRQFAKMEEAEQEEVEMPLQTREESINRISVKDGARIHIVQIPDLLCIQACGDYVTLITPEGQYIKEQTMKYYETHLPSSLFVRIHRSYIVNTNYIVRVELFGKESYRIKLTNGISLKASNNGYKLLKERLNL